MPILYVQILFVFKLCNNICDGESAQFSGNLTSECMKNYHRILEEEVPLRTYKYFHELDSNRCVPQYHGRPGNCDNDEHSYRIMGGNQISIREAPYQVLYGMYCGGTLIAPEWVITAAHCKDKEKVVLAGSTQRSRATSYPICAHFIHPYWNSSHSSNIFDFDYQLVLLEKPVPITPNSRPIMIGSIDDIQPGTVAAVSGWGYLHSESGKMQDVLRRVYVPIWSKEECLELPHKNYKDLSPRMFCAGFHNGTKDSCQGDSGGPLVVNNKLVGLVSFGIGCGMPNLPGAYTNIPLARKWIRSITGLPL